MRIFEAVLSEFPRILSFFEKSAKKTESHAPSEFDEIVYLLLAILVDFCCSQISDHFTPAASESVNFTLQNCTDIHLKVFSGFKFKNKHKTHCSDKSARFQFVRESKVIP